MRYPLSLVPIVSNYILKDSSDYKKFSRLLLNPVVIYKTDEWAANPFGNPFSPCFSWPLNPCPIDREWFIPGKDWDKWLKKMYDFVNDADPGRRERYKNALRWFAKSIGCKDADERLVDLFIALNTLCCEEIRGRGIGITIGEFCSKRE